MLFAQIIATATFVAFCYLKANYRLASDLELTIEMIEKGENKKEAA